MRFWDASAIVPLCLEAPHTPALRRLTEEDGALAVWWGTPVECYSAFARLRREARLSRAEEDQARDVLAPLAAQWTEIEPGREIREMAGRALLLHPLRAADSLQLAAALVWADGRPAGHDFVCLDRRLREAATREGFSLLPVLEDRPAR